MSVSVVLVDDHPIVRQGLRALLESQPDIRIAGEAEDGLEAVELLDRVKPDVVVLDLMMPGLNGLDTMIQARQRSPRTHIVVLSMYANEAYVLEAMRNGAEAYVLKKDLPEEALEAIREVVAGRPFLSRTLSAHAIELYRERASRRPEEPHDRLTNREREVLQLTVEGHTTADVAARLSISKRTVEMHRANLMRKLGLRTRVQLIRYALRRGILPMEDELS